MEQRIPNISDSDIERIIKRDFPRFEIIKIAEILKMYKSESIKGRNRIYASILKLSNGNIEMIKKYVEKANTDYRDVIALSEYPNYSEHAFEDLSVKRKEQLIMEDWTQYEAWLNGGMGNVSN
jgi:predicted RNA-binding protein